MNDEDAFQAALDTHPDDHITRLVFADWLQDRDDPRAEGYRALARLGIHAGRNDEFLAFGVPETRWFFWCRQGNWWVGRGECAGLPLSGLPLPWFRRMDHSRSLNPNYWRGYTMTRRECEDMAAVAFPKMFARSRRKLLAFAAV